jgi:hypothetical protein
MALRFRAASAPGGLASRPSMDVRCSVPRFGALGSTLLAACAASLLAACGAGADSTGLSPNGASTATTGGGGASTTSSAGGQGGGTSSAGGGTSSAGTGGAAGQGGAGGAPPMSICPPDADGDTLSDEIEGRALGIDTDKDGTPDYLDLDSDNDTLPDELEGQTASNGCQSPQDSDGDGTPDFQDTDSDNNGLLDRDEIYPDGSAYDAKKAKPNPADTNGDGVPDYADKDNDGDTLLDTVELAENDGSVHKGKPIDTDGDGLPDLDDVDSDNDTIADSYEGISDPDKDGIPAFRDLDSDGDGLPDTCEAGANGPHKLGDPPTDSDQDGTYDFLDVDSDNDGLLDTDEDANHNCVLDDGETDPYDPDTDHDGVSDLVELTLGSNPRDPNQTPASLGKYYFVLPYQLDVVPQQNIVPIKTTLNQGDVAFVVDTSAPMASAIQTLKLGMSDIIAALHKAIPDVAVGIAGHDDFPTGLYGSPGVDLPFYVAGPNGYVSTSLGDNLGAVQALNVHDGQDQAQSQIAAYSRALTDQMLLWPGGQIVPSGAPGSTYGSLHFRNTALPILVGITTNPFHDGRRVSASQILHDPYSFNGQQPYPTPTVDDLVTTMTGKGAQFIGISLADGARSGADPYEDMAYLADQTGAYVPASAFGGVQCGTGLAGTFLPPDGPATPDNPGGTCRLVFDVAKNGTGMTTSVVTGVKALLQSLKLDVRVLAQPEPNDPLDAVDTFIDTIEVYAPGGDDPAEPGVPCFSLDPVKQLKDVWQGAKGLVKVQDGINETALGIVPSQKICFKVIPKPNVTIQQQGDTVQVYTADLLVRATRAGWPGELVLGSPHAIAFIVPPAPQ